MATMDTAARLVIMMKRIPSKSLQDLAGRWSVIAVLLLGGMPLLKAQSEMQQVAPVGQSVSSQSRERMDAAAAMARGGAASPAPEDLARLPLAPGFLISINVLDEPDVAGNFRVDQEGNLDVPIIGTIHVAGLTMPETSRLLREKLLDGKILKDPQVTVNIVEYSAPHVTILGEVMSPGKYALLAPHPLEDVLALAGGLGPMAGNEVEIVAAGKAAAAPTLVSYSRDSSTASGATTIVNPGDTVRVKRAGIVYVIGAVLRPGGYVMQEDGTLNLMQALSLASGTSPVANTSTLHILRPNDDGSVMDIPVSYKRLMEGKTAPILLQAKDVVYVPASKMKAALMQSSEIMSSAAAATIYTVR